MAGFIAGTLAEKVGWGWGFASAGIGMIIGLLIFIWGQNKYLQGKGLAPKRYTADKGAEKQKNDEPLTKDEKQRIAVIFIMAFFSIFFWTVFEQKGAALNLIAKENLDRVITIFGHNFEIPATWFQSVNPFFIILLAPLFSKIWVMLGRIGKDPSIPAKFMIAFWFIALGYGLMLIASIGLSGADKIGMLWLIGAYLLFTMGELCLSPVGLSMVTKLSPPKFISLLMGAWFLANAAAGKLAGFYSGLLEKMTLSQFFTWPTLMPIAASLLLLLLIKPINRWMHGVK